MTGINFISYQAEERNNQEKIIVGLQVVECSMPGITTLITRLLHYGMNPEALVGLVDILHNLTVDLVKTNVRYRQIKINMRKNNDTLMIDNVESTTSVAVEKKLYT